jgi:hypothetical protein
MQYVIWNETKKAYWNGCDRNGGSQRFASDLNEIENIYSQSEAESLCDKDEIAVPVNITRADSDNLRPKEETTR